MRLSTRLIPAIVPALLCAQSAPAWLPDARLVKPAVADTTPLAGRAPAPELKSANTALAWSLGTTLGFGALGYATMKGSANVLASTLLVTGLYLGPSTGYWYGDSPKWKLGLIARSIALGVGAAGAVLWGNSGGSLGSTNTQGTAGGLLMIGGAVVIVVSDIVDIANVKQAVREANEKKVELGIAPTITPDGRRSGMAVTMRF